MQTDPSDVTPGAPNALPGTPAESLSSEALARRRALLKGLSKGSAVAAVVVPINSLATTTVLGGNKLCTVSGVQSNVGSATIGGATCQGYSTTYYAKVKKWPGYTAGPPASASFSVSGRSCTQNSTFKDVFGGGSTNTLMTIITSAPGSDEAAWVAALLNALNKPPGFNFPYSADQVVTFYKSPTQSANALYFFKTYMQMVN